MPQSYHLARLLASNERWADDVEAADPDFFTESAKGQTPIALWIGCADSRVPESVVTASKPGTLFVHRNIANQFHPNDDNVLSVLTYAVVHLGVDHVIIAGHTNCGGAAACRNAAQEQSAGPPSDPLGRWLVPLTELAKNTDGDLTALVEANVRAQVDNVVRSQVIQDAWAKGRDVLVHGWVYDLETGKLRVLDITVGKDGPQ